MPTGIDRISTDAIRSELRRRERLIAPLQRRRARAAAKLARIDRAIAALGGSPSSAPSRNGAARGRRPRNAKTLVETLAGVLRGKTMSVTDAVAAARRAGYRTAAKNFYGQVAIALAKSERFRRVGRGQYRAK